MAKTAPTILGLDATEWTSLVQRAVCNAVRETLQSGIPVTGMVDGEIRVIHPTDTVALELLKHEPASEHASVPPT
jgi:hypothetical protein